MKANKMLPTIAKLSAPILSQGTICFSVIRLGFRKDLNGCLGSKAAAQINPDIIT
jgi:hypothetical protein